MHTKIILFWLPRPNSLATITSIGVFFTGGACSKGRSDLINPKQDMLTVCSLVRPRKLTSHSPHCIVSMDAREHALDHNMWRHASNKSLWMRAITICDVAQVRCATIICNATFEQSWTQAPHLIARWTFFSSVLSRLLISIYRYYLLVFLLIAINRKKKIVSTFMMNLHQIGVFVASAD